MQRVWSVYPTHKLNDTVVDPSHGVSDRVGYPREVDSITATWGYAPSDLYHERWNLIVPYLPEAPFVLIDWGSDSGWFSVKVAHDFPKATVLSVESGVMSGGAGIALHRDKIELYDVGDRDLIIPTMFGPETFVALANQAADYQFVLSVFHHMGDGFGRYLRRRSDWDRSFCDLVQCARVTFLELPNETSQSETPHRVRRWYAHRPLKEVLEAALRNGEIEAHIEIIGQREARNQG